MNPEQDVFGLIGSVDDLVRIHFESLQYSVIAPSF